MAEHGSSASIPNPSSAFIRRGGLYDTIDMHATSSWVADSWLVGAELPFEPVFELLKRHDMTVSFYPRRHETSGRQAFSSQGRQIRGGRRRPPASPLLAFLTTRVIKRFSGNFGSSSWPAFQPFSIILGNCLTRTVYRVYVSAYL